REIVGDAVELFFRDGVQEPEKQEERHHRCYEVGVSDLPGAAVVASATLLDAFDDDGRAIAAFAAAEIWAVCHGPQGLSRTQFRVGIVYPEMVKSEFRAKAIPLSVPAFPLTSLARG